MTLHPRVLVVAPTGGITRTLAPSLRSAGFEPDVVSDFASAKEVLETGPELLITELKLGAFNGLHLAIRAGAQGTPTIIVGEPDPVLEAEAKRQHATYLTSLANHDEIISIVRELLSTAMHTRRSPRKQVPLLDAFVNDLPARLLDVSYEGLRLEAVEHASGALPPHFTVRLPVFNFSCAVQRVWTAPLRSDAATGRGSISCGAELTMDNADTALVWRTLVDAMPGLAFSS
jgi:ActR/RegA family two-component response regulator